MAKDGSSRWLSWNSAPVDSELQGPTFTHNAQGPSWLFCTPLPRATHRPQHRISLYRVREAQRGKGCRIFSVDQLAEKEQYSRDSPSALCDPGPCVKPVSLVSSIITITPKCFYCGCYYGCYLVLCVINVSIQNNFLEQTILNKNNTSATDYY